MENGGAGICSRTRLPSSIHRQSNQLENHRQRGYLRVELHLHGERKACRLHRRRWVGHENGPVLLPRKGLVCYPLGSARANWRSIQFNLIRYFVREGTEGREEPRRRNRISGARALIETLLEDLCTALYVIDCAPEPRGADGKLSEKSARRSCALLSWRKAAAFDRWHEPEKSRGLRPVL